MKRNYMAEKEFRRIDREVESEMLADPVKRMYYENKRSLSAKASYIAKNVILQYGSLSSQELSELSHKEISWRNARMKLASRENGSVPLSIEDIRKDAEKVRPYDSVYDMYYDEFEDTVVAQ